MSNNNKNVNNQIKKEIIEFLKKKKLVHSYELSEFYKELARKYNLNKETIRYFVKQLVKEGVILKTSRTKGKKYYTLNNLLNESELLSEIKKKKNEIKNLSERKKEILDYIKRKKPFFHSNEIDKMAKDLNISKKTLQTHLWELNKAGLLKSKKLGEKTEYSKNVYFLTDEKEAERYLIDYYWKKLKKNLDFISKTKLLKEYRKNIEQNKPIFNINFNSAIRNIYYYLNEIGDEKVRKRLKERYKEYIKEKNLWDLDIALMFLERNKKLKEKPLGADSNWVITEEGDLEFVEGFNKEWEKYERKSRRKNWF